jgi:hypothetical protein
VDGEVGKERERVGQRDEAVLEAGPGDLHDVEPRDGLALPVAQEGEGGAEAGPEGGADFRAIGGDDGQAAVVDGQLVLQLGEVP